MQSKQRYHKDSFAPKFSPQPIKQSIEEYPQENRSFTDCIMLFIFILSWIAFITITVLGIMNGHPGKLYHPYDSTGHECGENEAKNYPYLYWPTPESNVNNNICVNMCPASNMTIEGIDGNQYINSYGPTHSVFGLCIPTSIKDISMITNTLDIGFIQQSIADIQSIWYMIFAIVGIALIISFLYTTFMRYFSGFMAWTIILTLIISLGLFGALCLYQANHYGTNEGIYQMFHDLSEKSLRIIGIILLSSLGLILLMLCMFYKKVTLSIAILKCSSQFVQELPMILLIPPLFFCVMLGFVALWIFSLIMVISCNKITPSGHPFPNIQWIDPYQYEAIYLIFFYLWNHSFLIDAPQFVIISACVYWYYQKSNSNKQQNPVWWGLCTTFWKNFGSIAFGSLIISIIESIRIIMDYLHKKLKPVTENNVTNYCIRCIQCCLDCFERVIMFINRHAYIQIAITGANFCKGSYDAFVLIAKFASNLAISHVFGQIVVFIGTLCITIITTFIGFILLTRTSLQEEIFSPTVPILIFALVSYIIGSNFMNVYGSSSDTIIHCYLMDYDMGKEHIELEPLRDFAKKANIQKKVVDDNDVSNNW